MRNPRLNRLVWIVLFTLSFIPRSNKLVGRWQKKFPDGTTATAVFRADSSLDFFLNGKAFGSGRYYVRNDTFALTYASCNLTYYGTYKLNFFAPDSVRFAVVQDTCSERRKGMDGVSLGRVRNDKP